MMCWWKWSLADCCSSYKVKGPLMVSCNDLFFVAFLPCTTPSFVFLIFFSIVNNCSPMAIHKYPPFCPFTSSSAPPKLSWWKLTSWQLVPSHRLSLSLSLLFLSRCGSCSCFEPSYGSHMLMGATTFLLSSCHCQWHVCNLYCKAIHSYEPKHDVFLVAQHNLQTHEHGHCHSLSY